jgi:hypothetical protein
MEMQEMTMDEIHAVAGSGAAGNVGWGVAINFLTDGIKWIANDYASRDWGGAGGDAYNDMGVMTGGENAGGRFTSERM